MYSPEICFYHGDCLDGFTAAWAIWKSWPRCEFRPGHYGKPLPLDGIAGKNVLFVDFSASAIQLEAIGSVAASVIVLDHHKTAEADLEAYRSDFLMEDFNVELKTRALHGRSPIVAFFDMERSGASMAWEFANIDCGKRASKAVPSLIVYVEDRDLWRFRYGDRTRAIAAALQTYPMEFDVWSMLSRQHLELEQEGNAILRANRANVAKILKDAYEHTIANHTVPVVNSPYHYASDAGNELLKAYPDAPFAATWFRRSDGFIQWSLRSEEGRIDVSEIAKRLGGGGHRNAAGFQEVVHA